MYSSLVNTQKWFIYVKVINKGKSIKLIHTTKYIKSKLAQNTIRDRIERVMGKYQLINKQRSDTLDKGAHIIMGKGFPFDW